MSLAQTCQVNFAIAFFEFLIIRCHFRTQVVANAQRSSEYGTGFQTFLVVAEAAAGFLCMFAIYRYRGLSQSIGGEVQLPRFAHFTA